MSNPPPPEQRLRITFGKRDALIYIGHLDLARMWERVLRRAGLPLAYSHGFNPRPRVQLADALPLGVSSACELIDVWLKTPASVAPLPGCLQAVAPSGLLILSVAEVDLNSPALQTLVTGADYVITIPDDIDSAHVQERIDAFLARAHVERERRGKRYDLRPLVRALNVTPEGRLHATLSLGEAGTARPDELLDALELSGAMAHVHRERLHLRG